MQFDSQTIVTAIAVAIGVLPLLVLIVTTIALFKIRQVLARLDEVRKSSAQPLEAAMLTQSALARNEESAAKLRMTIERLEKNADDLMAAQRGALEQTIAQLAATAGALEGQQEIARQFQSTFRDVVERFEQAAGRFLAAQQAVFEEAHEQLEKTAAMLATPANGAQASRLSHAATRIGGILRGVLRPTPALKAPEPQPESKIIDAQKVSEAPAESSLKSA